MKEIDRLILPDPNAMHLPRWKKLYGPIEHLKIIGEDVVLIDEGSCPGGVLLFIDLEREGNTHFLEIRIDEWGIFIETSLPNASYIEMKHNPSIQLRMSFIPRTQVRNLKDLLNQLRSEG